ncbi:malectin domain-containing carbohydrate-binding protein [Maribacter forsetii]|uniref:malectin domain-containing carbohydrate-binding protein n=1 Tax=Maribacter forsetii TaxID=444515 RepID=UPI00068AC568|nr:malectin domain-containing carbohydrate-binding protein [Maribacter forsetii]
MKNIKPNHSIPKQIKFILICLGITLPLLIHSQDFGASGLSGESSNNPTSLQFGPDDRLYVSQQNGTIYSYTINRNGANDYDVVATETINLVQNIQNHSDITGLADGQGNRQVTGIYVTGTAYNPKLYVSSSDPRIGAGGGGNDSGLDTNSGMLSCLTCIGGVVDNICTEWEKVDLVRGLPRSEENHATNGIQIDETTNTLYLAVGGHTNAGAPSNNFALTTEYVYSAAIIKVNLSMLESMPVKTWSDQSKYKYDLPTLDDPTRPNVNGIDDINAPGYDGIDPGDPFGGNDGLNQAKIDLAGPVQLHATGFRNLYDIILTESGKMYGVDNGANGGWGGHPEGEADYTSEIPVGGTATVTNNFLSGEPGSNGSGPGGDDKVNNKNGLHYIRPLVPGDFNYAAPNEIYYGGHPAPIRANPVGAGLYVNGTFRNEILSPDDPNFANSSLPVDWPPVPASMANPAEGDFRNSGQDDNTLSNYGPSTNGLTEYTASNFDNALKGNLLLAAYNGNIYKVVLSEDGKVATNCPDVSQNGTSTVGDCSNGSATFASGFGSNPLDVIAQGDNDTFAGTVWAVTYGEDNITIFEPTDYNGIDPGTCDGLNDDTIDDDGDGYTNADEIASGSNPCSGASQPNDFDDVVEYNGFKRSDFNDTDDDNDGILDVNDAFCFDAENGKSGIGNIPFRLDLFNSTGYGFGTIGYTGIMTNGTDDYLNLIDDVGDELVFGGTAGVYTDPSVSDGDAYQATNSQKNAFQFPINSSIATGSFSVLGQINGPFFNDIPPVNYAAHGIFIGSGNQDNYLKLTLRNNGGTPALQILYEENGVSSDDQVINVPGILAATAIKLYLSVDPGTGSVQASYTIDSGDRTEIGNPVTVSGDLLAAVQGSYTINGVPSALAAGPIATSANASPEFSASWDYFLVEQNLSETSALVEINTNGIDGSTYGNSSFYIKNNAIGANITNVTFNLATALLPEVVFDPNGNAGDGTSKDFTANAGGDVTTGKTTHTFANPYEGGFYELSIDFNDFEPTEEIAFGLDVDPISIKGGSSPGPNDSGSVSGLELAGSMVTVSFDTGEVWTIELYRTQPDSDSQSVNVVRNALPNAPVIEMLGVESQSVVSNSNQTIIVTAPVDANVSLLQLEAGLFIDGLTGPYADVGYNIDPWEINSIINIQEFDGIADNSSQVTFPVTLSDSDEEAGFAIFAAVVVDDDGATSNLSNYILVEFDEAAVPAEIIRINAGGPAFTDNEGNEWSADEFFVGGELYANAKAIENTVDDVLYQTERYATVLNYEIPVTQVGTYNVNLSMAELFFTGGNGGVGARVFDIEIEGQTEISAYDIFADVGTATAVTKQFSNINVTDGFLSIVMTASTNNAKLSTIEVLSSDIEVEDIAIIANPISNQSNQEGTEALIDVAATGGNGNLIYTAIGLPNGLDLEPTNGDIFGTILNGAAFGGPNSNGIYPVTITVDDSDSNTEDAQIITFTWTVTPGAGGGVEQVLYRVNVGGPLTVAADGSELDWGADQSNFGLEGNSPYLSASTVGNSIFLGSSGAAHPGSIITTDPSLDAYPEIDPIIFNSERYDAVAAPEMLWQFPVETGTQVEIVLLFAELYNGISGIDQRVFDISVDGEVPSIFTAIDPYAIAGPKGAFVRSFTTVSDGVIDLEFIHGVENPALKGIQIKALNFSGNLAPKITAIATKNNIEGEEVNVQIVALDDDNCGEFIYTASNLPTGLTMNSSTGLISGVLEEGTGGSGVDGAFIEENGLVIIEAETDFVESPSGWNLEPGSPSYLVASQNNYGNATGGQVLTYNVQISTPGVYRLHMKSEFTGTNATEENDTWFKVDNTADVHFFSVQGGALSSTSELENLLSGSGSKTLYYPAGNAQGRPNHGNENPGSKGFFKVYRSGGGGNKWDAKTIDNNGFPIYAYFPNSGTFSVQISERSAGHKVDRFGLTNIDLQGTGVPTSTLNGAESLQVEGGSAGASESSPYAVQVSVSDNCSPAASSVINFDWIVSQGQSGVGSALVQVTPGLGIEASTYGNNSFIIENTGTVDITRLEIETTSAFMFDVVFDPVGTAGDSTAKCLTPGNLGSGAVAVGQSVIDPCLDPFFNPHNGVDNSEGFDGVAVDFTDFNSGETFYFGADMDPTSIKGDLSAGDSGSISGFELIGAKVTVYFANGQSYTSALWDQGSLGGSDAIITETDLTAPIITAAGLSAPSLTNNSNQTINIIGEPNATVELLRVDSHLFIDPGNPTVGYDVDPFEANSAMAKELYSITLDASGIGSVPVILTKTLGTGNAPDGGLNHFIAITTSPNGNSIASNIIVLEYDPEAVNSDVNLSYTLQSWNNSISSNIDFTVEVYTSGVETPVLTTEINTTVSEGLLSFSGLEIGTYNLVVKANKHLQIVLLNVDIVNGVNSFDLGQLLGGDTNNDNQVTALDFSLLVASFNISEGSTGYNEAADINGDKSVSALDFSLLVSNFNQQGDVYVP